MTQVRDEGTQQHSTLEAWNVSENDFPKGGSLSEKMHFLVRYAILAPSGHNTQPWLFKIVGNNIIEIYADRSRALPLVDPDDRELVISCGAALYNLRLAANHFGLAHDVQLLPDKNNNPDLLARISLNDDVQPNIHTQAEDETALFEAITMRRSNRSPFENRKLPNDLLASLKDSAKTNDAWLDVIDDEERKNALADLISQGDRIQLSDKRFRRELAAWIHPNRSKSRDGMPGYAHGMTHDIASHMGPFLIRTFDIGKGQAAKDKDLASGSPVLAVLGTDGDEPLNWIQTGQALARILLQARARGVWTTYMNQPIEVPELRPSVLQTLGRNTGFPQLLVRLGYSKEVKPTPRREIDDVIVK
jgi:Nitroreductase family